MNYQTFCKNVENYILYNMYKKSNEIMNNLINLSFNYIVIENIKLGIEEQFSEFEENVINEIYRELFEEFDFKYENKKK